MLCWCRHLIEFHTSLFCTSQMLRVRHWCLSGCVDGWEWRRGSRGAESHSNDRSWITPHARAAIGRLRTIPVMFGQRPDQDLPDGWTVPASAAMNSALRSVLSRWVTVARAWSIWLSAHDQPRSLNPRRITTTTVVTSQWSDGKLVDEYNKC